MTEPNFSAFEPVRRSTLAPSALTAGVDPLPSAPSAAPATAAPALAAPAAVPEAVAPTPVPLPAGPVAPAVEPPRFVEGRGRIRKMTIDLLYPIEFEGRVYEAITLRRPTSAEVGAFFERLIALREEDPEASLQFPIFVDEGGRDIPPEVIAFLDGEDDEAVLQASADFLPPRLRRLREAQQPASTPDTGENIAQ